MMSKKSGKRLQIVSIESDTDPDNKKAIMLKKRTSKAGMQAHRSLIEITLVSGYNLLLVIDEHNILMASRKRIPSPSGEFWTMYCVYAVDWPSKTTLLIEPEKADYFLDTEYKAAVDAFIERAFAKDYKQNLFPESSEESVSQHYQIEESLKQCEPLKLKF